MHPFLSGRSFQQYHKIVESQVTTIRQADHAAIDIQVDSGYRSAQYQTGHPGFLVDLLRQSGYPIAVGLAIEEDRLDLCIPVIGSGDDVVISDEFAVSTDRPAGAFI